MNENHERLTEFGVPVDALVGVVREELANAAQTAAAIQQSPAGQWLSAHQRELSGYLQARPELGAQVSRLAQGDALGAVEFLKLRYEAEGGRVSGGGGGSVNTGFGSGAELLPIGGDNPLSVEAAARRYERDGSRRSAEQYARARLSTILENQFNRAGQSLAGDPF